MTIINYYYKIIITIGSFREKMLVLFSFNCQKTTSSNYCDKISNSNKSYYRLNNQNTINISKCVIMHNMCNIFNLQ